MDSPRIVNRSCCVGGEDCFGGADADWEGAFGDSGLVKVAEVGGVFHACEAGEATDIEVSVTGGDDFNGGAVALEEAGKLRGFGGGEALLEWKEDGIGAEGEGTAECGAEVHTGGGSLVGAGGNLGVLFGGAANDDGAGAQLWVIAPGEGDEKVGNEEARDLHWIWKGRTSVLRFPDWNRA